MDTHFDFCHMNLVPQKCIVESRSDCDTSTQFGPYKFKLPVIPANMECVINQHVAEMLATEGYFYIMHRFQVDLPAFTKHMYDAKLPISISIGVNEDSYEILKNIKETNIMPHYITIDIAHGHSVKMERMICFIRELWPGETQPFIIAGNVSSGIAVKEIEKWGVNAVKCGIGPGFVCTTYPSTGFGSRGCQASVIKECADAATTSLIIADGGIREPGDIAKSFALGAHMVMIGGMFSGLKDAPGTIVLGPDGHQYKEFWGSASAFQSGKKERIEGTKKLIPLKDHGYMDEMKHLTECLQSAISYGGGKRLDVLHTVKYLLKNSTF